MPRVAAARTGLRLTFTVRKVCRSRPLFIITWPAARLRQIAVSGAAASMFCEKRRFRQCWLNAASLPTRPKRITPRVLPTSRNSRKKSAVVSANARSLPAPQRLTVSPPTIRRSRSSRSSIKLITATRTLPDRSAASEARRVRQNRHRRSASILPIPIRRKGARPEKRNRPPRKRRISWNRPC